MRTQVLVVTLVLGIFCCFESTNAQFEDLEACIFGDFVPEFGRCMVDSILGGFTGILVNVDEEIEGKASGRKLQSLQSDYRLSNGAKKYYIDMKLNQAGITEDKVFDNLKRLAKLWALGTREDVLIEKLKSLDLRKLIGDKYMHILYNYLGDILEPVMMLKDLDDVFIQDKSVTQVRDCLATYPDAAFEDSIDWLQCLVSCDDLGPLWTCTTEALTTVGAPCSNVVWFVDSVVAIMASLLNKSHCDFVVETTEPLQLIEGGDSVNVTFRSYLPPGVLCIGPDPLGDPIQLGLAVVGNIFGFAVTCDAEMQITTSNWKDDILPYTPNLNNGNPPKCRIPNRALRQVAIGFHDAAANNSGMFKITNDNWNTPYVIPLLPVVDHRTDGDVNVNLTLKMFAQGARRGATIKLPVSVQDTDVSGTGLNTNIPVECYSLNDPHIMTFDGFPYNNYYQGAFYLYKHVTFPYEVQAIYQPCQRGNGNATCNCAVAVRSGDDVFVMDRCRRCQGDTCETSQITVLYTQGALTPGTRIFKMDSGLRHDVVLPHGTIIKIITSNDLLNVWIRPGSYDKNNTEGLCGTYNGVSTDDLRTPDGTQYLADDYSHPDDFNLAWRVPDEELIFLGYGKHVTFEPLNTCVCSATLMSSAECECGRGSATELCDLFMENEYTADNISSIVYASLNNGSQRNYLDGIDLDINHQPANVTDWPVGWNETTANTFCENVIASNTDTICNLDQEHAKKFCMQDIQILGNTDWQYSAIDNAVFRCFNKLVRDPATRSNELLPFVNSSCVNQCSGQGLCAEGSCLCYDGFHGPSCQPIVGDSTPYLNSKDTQLCDMRKQLCHFATIYGENFPDDGTMLCQIKDVEISPVGVDYLPIRYTQTWERVMSVINSNQAVCPLPMNGSYEVYTVWDGQPVASSLWSEILPQSIMGTPHNRLKRHTTVMDAGKQAESSIDVRFIYIAYDSACYSCDAITQSCVKKSTPDHCWINSTCWAPGETKPEEPCRYCAPEINMADWTIKDDTDVCRNQTAQEEQDAEEKKKDLIIRGAVGGSISALVVVIVLIMFCVSRKKEKAAKSEEGETLKNSVEPKRGNVFYNDSNKKGYENPSLINDEHLYEDVVGVPRKTRVDVLKSEEGIISDDSDNHSLNSMTLKTEL